MTSTTSKEEVVVNVRDTSQPNDLKTGRQRDQSSNALSQCKIALIPSSVLVILAIVLICVFTVPSSSSSDNDKAKVPQIIPSHELDVSVRSIPERCEIKVEDAQFYDVIKIDNTDSTLVLNKYNKKAYVLTPELGGLIAQRKVESTTISGIPDGYTTMYLTTPLKNVTVAETQMIRYLELLGVRSAIGSISPYTSSPCLTKMKEDGQVSTFAGNLYDFSAPPSITLSPTFVGYSSAEVATTTIQGAVSMEQKDGTMLQSSEWIKYFAPFFEKECEANTLYEGIKERYNCHKTKVQQFFPSTSPKVVVAQKNFGYNCGEGCPYNSDPYFGVSDAAYWTSYIKDAGGIPLIETSTFTNLTADPFKGYTFTNASDFHAVLKEADIVIDTTYMASGISTESILEAYNITASDESGYKFIGDKALWRTDARIGPNGDDWFEGRYAEADVLLEDFLFALHPSYSGLILNPKHELTWLRNLYTIPGQTSLTADTCTDVTEAAQLIADSCTSFKTN